MSNPLTDVLPATVRKYVYAALFLTAVVLGVWQATDGNVVETILGVLAALGFGTATANTKPPQQ